MGSSTQTPNLELPLFADGDKPTWRGDINDAMTKIDTAINGKVDKVTADYYVVDYGALADGSNDQPHIQSAIDYASAHGGGFVHLKKGATHSWSGEIFVKDKVTLCGDVENFNGHAGATNQVSLKALDNTSRLRCGAWAGNAGSTNGDQPGGLDTLVVDGNGVGPTGMYDGLLLFEGTNMGVNQVYVQGAAGAGMYFEGTQNSEITGCTVINCLRGVVHDNGAGGLLFTRCEIANNGTGLVNTDNPGVVNAYPFGPAHVTYEHCIVETYIPATILVDIQCGTINFTNSNFGNNITTALAGVGALINISNPIFTTIGSYATFNDCLFYSAAADYMVMVTGNNSFYLHGQNYIQGSNTLDTTAFVQNGGQGVGQIDGYLLTNHIATTYAAINGGAIAGWAVSRVQAIQYTIDGSAGLPTAALIFKRKGDAGIRGTIDSNGTHTFSDGAHFTQVGAIGLDPTNVFLLYYNPTGGHAFTGTVQFNQAVTLENGAIIVAGGLQVGAGGIVSAGKRSSNGGTASTIAEAFPVSAGVTIDCNLTDHMLVTLTAGTGVTALTINNATSGSPTVVGSRLRISYLLAVGTYNVLWPTGAVPGAGKTFPATLTEASGSTFWSIDFVNIGGNFYEVGRNF